MKRMNFTLGNRFGFMVGVLLVAFLGFSQVMNAQCAAPTLTGATGVGTTTATLNWSSNNAPANLHQWVLSVGGSMLTQGGNNCPEGGQALITATLVRTGPTTITSSNPAVTATVTGTTVSATVTNLPPGTDLEYYVSEQCTGMAPPNNISDCAGPEAFTTFDAPFTATAANITAPTCPFSSPGYVANGSFDVVVANSPTCPGTYTVNATPVAGSGPMGSTPPFTAVTTYIGFPQGNFFFGNAGAGTYTVTVTETSGCVLLTNPVVFPVVVPDGVDMVAPLLTVSDILGNVVLLSTPGQTAVDFGDITLPEGACSRQDQFFVTLVDDCDGFIVAPDAVTATAVTTPPSIDPGTQVSVVADGLGFYGIDVQWSVGETVLTIVGQDNAGNETTVTLTANVLNNVEPVVTILGNTQVTIPVCADDATLVYSVQVDAGCDQTFLPGNLVFNDGGAAASVINFTGNNYVEYLVTFDAAGNYLMSATYTDAFGGVGFFDIIINVQEAAENMPPAIFASPVNENIGACQDAALILFGFTVQDDCEPIDVAAVDVAFAPGAGVTVLNDFNTPAGPNTVYFEYELLVEPGAVLATISYLDTQVDPLIVVTQMENQPADIIMPTVNVTIPQCNDEVTAVFPVQILDDCDSPIVPANATFTLGGAAITPTFVNAAAGLFEFTEVLTDANDGATLVATYEDGAGNVSNSDVLITVNEQPDLFAPIVVYPSNDLNVVLDPCGPSTGLSVFEVSAYDNCPGDVTLVVEIGTTTPASATGDIDQFGSAGGDTYVFAGSPGSYQILITATDGEGNTRSEDFFINVTQDAAPETNLACIDQVNVTLDANCSVEIIPEMVLQGNFGCVDPSDLYFRVKDSNGDLVDNSIITECGNYTYEIGADELQVNTISGFTGPFAPENWTLNTGSTTGSALQNTFTFTSTDLNITVQEGGFGITFVELFAVVPSDGTVSFDYNLSIGDPGFQALLVAYNPGTGFLVLQQIDTQGAGTFTGDLEEGWIFGFSVQHAFGLGFPQLDVTINNFEFVTQALVEVPVCWGNILAEDKRPPVLTCQDEEIACTEVDELVAEGTIVGADALAEFANKYGFTLPTITDNCAGAELVSATVSQVSSTDICEDRTITITYTGRQDCTFPELTATCVSIVTVVRDDLATICDNLENFDGIDNDAIDCNDSRLGQQPGGVALDANGNPRPVGTNGIVWTGAPTSQDCNIQCAYNDINIPLCGVDVNSVANPRSARKILRTWTCVDWCIGGTAGQQVQTCTQIIKIKDDTAPIVRSRDLALKVMDNNACVYHIIFTAPEVTELCSEIVSVDVSINGGPFQPFVNGFYPSQTLQPVSARRVQLPVGENIIVYRAIDACGNIGTDTDTLLLEDKTPPNAICETFRVASLGADCRVRIFAEAFDDGSYDNCSPIEMHVRRMAVLGPTGQPALNLMPGIFCYEPFPGSGPENVRRFNNYNTYREWVDFCCDDFNSDEAALMVEFRVRDEAGNVNTCMVNVEVQDKIAPSGVRPADLTIDCNDEIMHWDFANLTPAQRAQMDEIFGTVVVEDPHTIPSGRRPISVAVNNPRIDEVQAGVQFLDGTAWDNCGGTECFSAERSESFAASDCRTGTITRVWQFRDAGGNILTLRQFITVVNFYPFMGGPNRRQYNSIGYYTTFRQQTLEEGNFDPRTYTKYEPTNNLMGFQNPFSEAGAFRTHVRAADPQNNTRGLNGYPTRFDVVWPADLEITMCAQGVSPDALEASRFYRSGARPYIWREDVCSQVGVAYDEWVFDFEAGCKKVIRKWKLIDWCQPQSVLNPWTWEQVIKVIDTDGPDFSPVTAVGAEGGDIDVACGGSVTFAFLDDCDNPANKPVSFVAVAKDPCAIEAEVDAIRWDWEVYPFGDRTSPIRRSSFPGQNFVPRGDTLDVNRAFPRTLPTGPAHIIKFIAEDGCGNKSTCEISFRIEDRKKPTPFCFSALSTDIMPEGPNAGEVEVIASLFNNQSTDNCEVVNFRLGQNTEVGQDEYTGGPRHLRTPLNTYESLIFTCNCPDVLPAGIADCDELRGPNNSRIRLVSPGEGVALVLWVGDGYGNWDYCNAVIRVDNNMGADCDDASFVGSVAGLIKTEVSEGVEFADVDVMINGISAGYMNTTDVQGSFQVSVPLFNSYNVTPERNDSPRNGVNVADILAIQRHILGVNRLDSPFKLIAADVTRDGVITAQDLIDIRRVLLNPVDFSKNTSWRFSPEDHTFADAENAHAEAASADFREYITINPMDDDRIDENFIGIKIGDVNNSVRANSQSLQNTTSRSRAMELVASEMELKAGNTYTVNFRSEDIANVEGYQFTLNFNTNKVVFNGYNAEGLELRDDNFGFSMLEEGMITTAWSTLNDVNLTGTDALFSLTFRAVEDAMLSEVLSANSAFTEAMAVSNGVEIGLNLVFETTTGMVSGDVYELYQNKPNPFANETIIGFTLPEDMSAALTVYDVTGKMVKFMEGDFTKGLNNVIIKRSELPASGVLYYQLEAGDFRATKKMIIIE